MSDSEKKSVTIRIDEADLAEWVGAQSSAVSSIRMAIKICMLQFGKNVDLSDAILMSQFGNGKVMSNQTNPNTVRNVSDNNNTVIPNNNAISEQSMSDNNQTFAHTQNRIQPQAQTSNQTQVPTNMTSMNQASMNQIPVQPQQPAQAFPMQPQQQNQNMNQGMSEAMASLL